MKKSIVLSLITVCLMFMSNELALSQETLTHGCYNWRRGRLRVVANPDQCNPIFENYISWHKAIPPGGYTIDLYVNETSGQDLPERGLTPTDPFKTITYALQQLIYLRPTQEIETYIYIAPSIYNENLIITGDNIRIIKDESYSGDVIIDGGGRVVFTIDGARKVIIDGITVQNGSDGIYGKQASSFELNNTIVQDCASTGVYVVDESNSQMFNCTIQRNGGAGVGVFRNSNAIFKGTINSNNNGGSGFSIQFNSSARFSEATITSNDNGYRGININRTSSLYSTNSSLTSKNNSYDGVAASDNSSISFVGTGSEVIASYNTQAGVRVTESSSAEIWGNLTSENNGNRGMYIYLASAVFIGGKVDILNNNHLGIHINSSEVRCISSGNLTVSGTRNNDATGILMCDNALFRSWGTLLVENNKDGNLNCGIYACRNSTVSLFPVSGVDAKIQNNASHGIAIHLSSVGRFVRNVQISGNTENGVNLYSNGVLVAHDTVINSNEGSGIWASDGSSSYCGNCNITGNNNGDVRLEWASRSELDGGSVGSVICDDNTVLTRGSPVCPP